MRGAVRSAVRGGALRVQQGTLCTGGAQAGRGKAEESKVTPAPTVKHRRCRQSPPKPTGPQGPRPPQPI